MKLMELPDKTKLELHFNFKNKNYCMEVELQMKIVNTIFIQAICCNGEPIDKMDINDPLLIYKTETGLYIFNEASYKLVVFKGTNMYAVSSGNEAEKVNRREAYRVYISEPVTLKITKHNRKVITLSGILKDISFTGMGIILPYKGEDIHTMEIMLELGRNTDITLLGEVVRIKELPNNKGYLYGCRFQTQKESLSRYIVSRQIHNKVHG
ncbi:MAG: PilZ domain-containing protein [Anaerocolumna sp.]